MTKQNIRTNLVMKDVELSDLSQFDELLRYVFQITKEDIDSSGYEDGELLRAKRPILKNADVIGWFHGKQLVSQIAIYPSEVNVFGNIYSMGGVTGVGTYPEYSNIGLMHELIVEALHRMRQKKQYISYLYPYSIPFYRKKGWEIITDRLTYTIKDTQLQSILPTVGQVKRFSIDEKIVSEIHHRFSLKTHGALIRNDFYWDEYWRWENEEERMAAVYYDEKEQAQGYLIYWIAEEIMHIKEIVTLNQQSWNGLWNFITAHVSMVNTVKGYQYSNEPLSFRVLDGNIKEMVEPYFMARIVDVKGFLEQYPFKTKNTAFHIEVKDPIAKWNQKTFGIQWEKDKIVITNQSVGEKLTTDIGTLTTMFMNYKRPRYLYKLERITCPLTLVEALESMIYDEKPYFSDYF